MLGRSIPIREALVHPIQISEVKDMKTDVLQALKASFSKKDFEPCRFNCILRKKNCIDFEFLSITFPLKYKNKVIFHFSFPNDFSTHFFEIL
jgi:hypothetical protein